MGSIKEKLEYLNETKRDIARALRSRGITVNPEDTFRSYAQKVMDITAEANLEVSPFEITQNGTYTADEGKAYNPVSVDVKPNLIPKTITEAGTYKAKDDECEGYSEVTVDVSDHIKVLTITKTDIGELPEKKIFKIKDTGIDDDIGYSEVIINCTAMVAVHEPIDIEPTKYGTENTYIASEDPAGIYGWSTFIINIAEDSGPFTVKYYNDSTLLYEETVEKGKSGYYVGDVPAKNKKIFKGWDPEPINVQRNLACFAIFEDEEEVIDGEGNIHEDWEQISRTKGADLEVGSSRTLYGGSITYDGFELTPGWSANCQLIGKYKDSGTTTTWAFTLPICARAFTGSGLLPAAGESGPITQVSESTINGKCVSGNEGEGVGLGWSNCGLKTLMGNIKSSLSSRTDKKYGASAAIASAIRQVTKYTRHYTKSRKSFEEYGFGVFETSNEELFVPSRYECTGQRGSDDTWESQGPVYSGLAASFTRTVSGFSAYCNGRQGESYRPYPDIGQGEVLTEILSFWDRSPNSNFYPYVYVNSKFNEDYKAEHGYSDNYWDHATIGYAMFTTQIFTSITVCFCL